MYKLACCLAFTARIFASRCSLVSCPVLSSFMSLDPTRRRGAVLPNPISTCARALSPDLLAGRLLARSSPERDLSASYSNVVTYAVAAAWFSDVANNGVIATGKTDDCNQTRAAAQPAHCRQLISSVISATAERAVESGYREWPGLSSYGSNYFRQHVFYRSGGIPRPPVIRALFVCVSTVTVERKDLRLQYLAYSFNLTLSLSRSWVLSTGNRRSSA